MDPDEVLARIRRLVVAGSERGVEAVPSDFDDLAELVAALDGWLTGGGFLPDAWARALVRDVPPQRVPDG